MREWRAANPERNKAIQKRNRVKNKATHRAQHKRWVAANPERWKQLRLEWRQANVAKLLWNYARNTSRIKKREFAIAVEDIVVPKNCPVFGVEIKYSPGSRNDWSTSLDRIDSKKGYVRGNIRVISWLANRLKSNATIDQLRKVVAYMEREQ